MPRGPMYEEIRRSIDEVLTGPLFKALRAVDCEVPPYDAPPIPSEGAFRAKVRVGHVAGTPEARYLVEGLGTRLELYVQLNVYRLVVVYRLPGQGTLDCGAVQPRWMRAGPLVGGMRSKRTWTAWLRRTEGRFASPRSSNISSNTASPEVASSRHYRPFSQIVVVGQC